MKLTLPQKKKPVHQVTPSMDTLPITGEVLACIFQECLNDLNRRTLDGLLGEADPSKLDHAQETQARVDKTWADCLAGRASLETFRQAVVQWHGAVLALFSVGGTPRVPQTGRLF